mmetsp:Transcript_62372/g.134164  ORF Transcript_62372/g.134164 Transcript_62372/m.134164 type:complete len:244 (-) Transcript_62372:31-762(-)
MEEGPTLQEYSDLWEIVVVVHDVAQHDFILPARVLLLHDDQVAALLRQQGVGAAPVVEYGGHILQCIEPLRILVVPRDDEHQLGRSGVAAGRIHQERIILHLIRAGSQVQVEAMILLQGAYFGLGTLLGNLEKRRCLRPESNGGTSGGGTHRSRLRLRHLCLFMTRLRQALEDRISVTRQLQQRPPSIRTGDALARNRLRHQRSRDKRRQRKDSHNGSQRWRHGPIYIIYLPELRRESAVRCH